jgi:hypothetical protein
MIADEPENNSERPRQQQKMADDSNIKIETSE